MALIQFNVEMRGIREALERIAICLERAFPEPIVVDEPADDPKPTVLHYVDPHAEWERERREMVEAGLDPEMAAYLPPRISRRGPQQ